MVAALAAALTGALVVGALAASTVLMLALALLQGVVIARWFTAMQVPGGVGGAVVAAGAAVAADLLVVARDEQRPLTPVAGVLGLTVVAAMLHQLARRDARQDETASISATTTVAALAVLGTGYLGVHLDAGGAPLVVTAVLAAGVVAALGALGDLRPLARVLAGLALVVAVGLVAGAVSDLPTATTLAVAAGCAAAAVLGLVFADRTPVREPMLVAGLPLLLAAPVAFVLGRILVG